MMAQGAWKRISGIREVFLMIKEDPATDAFHHYSNREFGGGSCESGITDQPGQQEDAYHDVGPQFLMHDLFHGSHPIENEAGQG